jgi:hypothetical protein
MADPQSRTRFVSRLLLWLLAPKPQSFGKLRPFEYGCGMLVESRFGQHGCVLCVGYHNDYDQIKVRWSKGESFYDGWIDVHDLRRI